MINFSKRVLSFFKRSKTGICCICDKSFPEKKIKEEDILSFCIPHYNFYKSNSWIKVQSATSNPTDPKQALIIQERHIELFANDILSFIKCNYLIKDDQIHTVFDLYIPQDHYKNYDSL